MSRRGGKYRRKSFWWFRSTYLPSKGFTLPETLVVVTIVGILASTAVAGWLGFANSRYLAAAQDEVFQIVRQAQIQAERTHANWKASFRETGGAVQLAVHPTTALNTAIDWQSLRSGIHIDPAETTLLPANSTYQIEFDYRGHILPPFGRLTLSIDGGGHMRRCVFTSTILGAVRKGSNRDRPDSTGRYCY
ncbi:MAG: hypothetical protein Kow00121_59030 [Elainellaceae cyanobacterium]